MEIHFHGAAQEVGRSCIEIRAREQRILLDAGIELSEEGGLYPSPVHDLVDIDALFLSHAHLDHTGALPLFHHYGFNSPIFSNYETKALTNILLRDSYKISRLEHEHIAYKRRDIPQILRKFKEVQYGKLYEYKGILFKYFNAGHIPGSASILLNIEGKNILYTGDINTQETLLLPAADTHYGRINIMIAESTYGNREHPSREEEIKQFLDAIEKTVTQGGRAVIAAFAVGRAQEILLMLAQRKWKVPIYLDGMARQVTELFLQYPQMIKDPQALQAIVQKVHFLVHDEQRAEAIEKPSIIISPSGMVNGGHIMHYAEAIAHDESSALFLTGYQASGTVGRMIEEEGKAIFNGHLYKLRCAMYRFDFSAHAGQKGLQEVILKTNPDVLILNHGDPQAIKALGEWALQEGITTFMPDYDDIISV